MFINHGQYIIHLLAFIFQIKRENLSTVCDCAGEFSPLVPVKDVRAQLATFRTIADYYKMPLLMELIQFNLTNM